MNNITAHMIIKNEDKWVWFSIMSIIDFVDQIIIFDTGSIDRTDVIISEIAQSEKYSSKVIYNRVANFSIDTFYKLREKQIQLTKTKYFMVIDGDEIWYQNALEELKRILTLKQPDLVATKFINCCGDIYHYRDFKRETYKIKDICGSITIRVYSKLIEGLHCAGDYGVEGYLDINNNPVQDSVWSIEFMENPYFHTSLLKRSSKTLGDLSIKYRRNKLIDEWDYKFKSDFKYPDVFYKLRPSYVDSPWNYKNSFLRKILHMLRKIKKVLKS